MLIVMSALGFLAPAYDLAQSPKASADMVLEVVATHTTMESEDTYVYLRVFSDRTQNVSLQNTAMSRIKNCHRQEDAHAK